MQTVFPAGDSTAVDGCDAAATIRQLGYCVFTGVLSEDELKRLRIVTHAHLRGTGRTTRGGGKKITNAAVLVPKIEWVFHHPKVLACARQAVGSDQVMYTNHADLQKNVMGGWHKDYDDSVRGSFERSTFAYDDFAVYKFALYLYDHDCDGGGLWVRDGSHRSKDAIGPIHDTAAKAGSMVAFDVRISHSGVPTGRFEGKFVDLPNYLPRFMRPLAGASVGRMRRLYLSMIRRHRMAIFFTFGLPNPHTLEFTKYIIEKQQGLEPGSSPRLPVSLRDKLSRNAVLLGEDQVLAPDSTNSGASGRQAVAMS